MQKWSFVLTALDGTPIGEILNASNRSLSLGLSRAATASFQIRAQNPRLLDLYQQDNLLQVWQDSTLRFWGPLVSSNYATQEDGSDPTIAVNAASPAWRLANRLAGKSGSGTLYTGDKADTAKKIIDATNAESDTGIKTVAVESGSLGTYTAGPYKPVIECLSELAHGLDGFDWYLRPITETSGKIAEFIAGPVIGGKQVDTVFEYGVGRHNIRSMTFIRDLSTMMNRAYHIPDEGADSPGATVVTKEELTSIGYRGLFEGIIDPLGLTDTTLREAWATANVEVRSNPRLVVTMTPDIFDPGQPGRVPIFGTDYNIGDFVRARAVMYGTQLFDGFVRVYNVQIDVDDNGRATTTPTLVDEETASVNTGGGIGSGPGKGGGGGAKPNPITNSIILT